MKPVVFLLTDWIDSEGRVRWSAEWSSSCRIAGSNPELVLCSFDQTSHLRDTETYVDSTPVASRSNRPS